MLHPPEGEVFVAKIKVERSSTPPSGSYIQLGIGRENDSARAWLSEPEAMALGRWLCRPTARKPSDRPQSPAAFRAFVAELHPAGERVSARATRRLVAAPPAGTVHHDGPTSPSGDHLVSSRFVTGVRERWGAQPTVELERELATFEPFLADMAKRLLSGVLTEHLGPDSTKLEIVFDACYREILTLLVALRGAYDDLWHGVLFDRQPDD